MLGSVCWEGIGVVGCDRLVCGGWGGVWEIAGKKPPPPPAGGGLHYTSELDYTTPKCFTYNNDKLTCVV